jgi:hypothetical protein
MAMAFYSESYSMRMYVHDMLFKQALLLFGTSEQQDKWMDDIENWRVVGCFAMVTTQTCWSHAGRGKDVLETGIIDKQTTNKFIDINRLIDRVGTLIQLARIGDYIDLGFRDQRVRYSQPYLDRHQVVDRNVW